MLDNVDGIFDVAGEVEHLLPVEMRVVNCS